MCFDDTIIEIDLYLLQNIVASSTSLAGGVATTKQRVDSDSDLDDFNYVLNETEKQLLKARQSLEKKKRQQPYALNDRHLRKYVNNIDCTAGFLNQGSFPLLGRSVENM